MRSYTSQFNLNQTRKQAHHKLIQGRGLSLFMRNEDDQQKRTTTLGRKLFTRHPKGSSEGTRNKWTSTVPHLTAYFFTPNRKKKKKVFTGRIVRFVWYPFIRQDERTSMSPSASSVLKPIWIVLGLVQTSAFGKVTVLRVQRSSSGDLCDEIVCSSRHKVKHQM